MGRLNRPKPRANCDRTDEVPAFYYSVLFYHEIVVVFFFLNITAVMYIL
jgi:hypothetical protein